MQDDGKRAKQADDSARRYRTRANVENVRGADLARTHLSNKFSARGQSCWQSFAKEFNQRDEHQCAEHSSRHHDGGGARTNDIADAKQFRGNLGRNRTCL